MILAGDIGGTKTTLGLFAGRAPAPGFDREAGVVETFDSRGYPRFGEILRDFLGRHPAAIGAASIGVAGPVRANRCAATNLPWIVDGGELARELGLPEVAVLNDLEAIGFGIDLLHTNEIVELSPGAPGPPGSAGHRAVIAAGTGLGEAGLFWDGAAHRPFASEGGHADFAPSDEREIALLRFLQLEHGHVSWERVVSGPGLVNLYRFLLQSETAAGDEGTEVEPEGIAAEMQAGDPAAVISRHAHQGTSARCARALELFVALYGAEAGNLALKTMATGGLYIAGGIAAKNLEWMRSAGFLEAFRAKGRMRPLLEAMPVRLVLNQRTALLGAARRAVASRV